MKFQVNLISFFSSPRFTPHPFPTNLLRLRIPPHLPLHPLYLFYTFLPSTYQFLTFLLTPTPPFSVLLHPSDIHPVLTSGFGVQSCNFYGVLLQSERSHLQKRKPSCRTTRRRKARLTTDDRFCQTFTTTRPVKSHTISALSIFRSSSFLRIT